MISLLFKPGDGISKSCVGILRKFATFRKCYYKVLGLPPNATAKEIKSAYYKLSMLHHPDRNRGSEAAANRFKEITEAYQVLSDSKRRQSFFDSTRAEYSSEEPQPGNKKQDRKNYNYNRKSNYHSSNQRHRVYYEYRRRREYNEDMNELHQKLREKFNRDRIFNIRMMIALFIISVVVSAIEVFFTGSPDDPKYYKKPKDKK